MAKQGEPIDLNEYSSELPPPRWPHNWGIANRDDHRLVNGLLSNARALGVVDSRWIANRAWPAESRRWSFSFSLKQRYIKRLLRGKRGFTPWLSRHSANELTNAIVSSGIAEFGLPLFDLQDLVKRLKDFPSATYEQLMFASLLQAKLLGNSPIRSDEQMERQFCGTYDVVCRDRNDTDTLLRDPNNGLATRSMLIVQSVDLRGAGRCFLACEISPYQDVDGARFSVRHGYAFRLPDSCVCLLFDENRIPDFVVALNGDVPATFERNVDALQKRVAQLRDGTKGIKTLYLSSFGAGTALTKVMYQSSAGAGLGMSRRRSREKWKWEDLEKLRKISIHSGASDPLESELILAAKDFPVLHLDTRERTPEPRTRVGRADGEGGGFARPVRSLRPAGGAFVAVPSAQSAAK